MMDSECDRAVRIVPQKPGQKRKRRKQVPLACITCRRSKTACSGYRPCQRCVDHGCADSCVDAPHRRKKNSASNADGNKLAGNASTVRKVRRGRTRGPVTLVGNQQSGSDPCRVQFEMPGSMDGLVQLSHLNQMRQPHHHHHHHHQHAHSVKQEPISDAGYDVFMHSPPFAVNAASSPSQQVATAVSVNDTFIAPLAHKNFDQILDQYCAPGTNSAAAAAATTTVAVPTVVEPCPNPASPSTVSMYTSPISSPSWQTASSPSFNSFSPMSEPSSDSFMDMALSPTQVDYFQMLPQNMFAAQQQQQQQQQFIPNLDSAVLACQVDELRNKNADLQRLLQSVLLAVADIASE